MCAKKFTSFCNRPPFPERTRQLSARSASTTCGVVNHRGEPEARRHLNGLRAIPEFHPRGWREIEGTSGLALVECDRDRPRADPGLAGPVKVGGKVYECVAVERTLNNLTMIPAGETISLLLRGVR